MGLVLVLMITFSLSCKKKVDLPPNNNEIKASIRYKSGKQIDIHVSGPKARMGCGMLGGGRYVEAYDEVNGSILLSSLTCLNSVGNYNNVYVRFTANVNSQTSPIYENHIITTPGGPTFLSIFTIKELRSDYIEGSFSSMAWYQKDTVLITGTYKGDYLK